MLYCYRWTDIMYLLTPYEEGAYSGFFFGLGIGIVIGYYIL
tara:strand:+ start:67 stop:189 length:123 start_codon:yes stop_codon:yes gene_type:complete